MVCNSIAESIGHEIKAIDHLMQRKMIMIASKSGLDKVTVMHGWIIGYLIMNKDRDIYQKDIESEFAISRSTVTNILKLMEKKGYLRRESVPNDARLKKLVLTPKGIDIHQKTLHDFATVEAELTRGITPEELETFYTIIEKLRKNVE